MVSKWKKLERPKKDQSMKCLKLLVTLQMKLCQRFLAVPPQRRPVFRLIWKVHIEAVRAYPNGVPSARLGYIWKEVPSTEAGCMRVTPKVFDLLKKTLSYSNQIFRVSNRNAPDITCHILARLVLIMISSVRIWKPLFVWDFSVLLIFGQFLHFLLSKKKIKIL